MDDEFDKLDLAPDADEPGDMLADELSDLETPSDKVEPDEVDQPPSLEEQDHDG